MTRDEMIAQFTLMIDRAYENGWAAGHDAALEDLNA